MDAICCLSQGGTPQGSGSVCSAPEACCYPDGSCQDLDPLICSPLGGTSKGSGTDCATTVCEVAEDEIKWDQLPDVSPWGLDVGNWLEPLFPTTSHALRAA